MPIIHLNQFLQQPGKDGGFCYLQLTARDTEIQRSYLSFPRQTLILKPRCELGQCKQRPCPAHPMLVTSYVYEYHILSLTNGILLRIQLPPICQGLSHLSPVVSHLNFRIFSTASLTICPKPSTLWDIYIYLYLYINK